MHAGGLLVTQTYRIYVQETRLYGVIYEVEAEDASEACTKACRGETVGEEVLALNGLLDREVGDILSVDGNE